MYTSQSDYMAGYRIVTYGESLVPELDAEDALTAYIHGFGHPVKLDRVSNKMLPCLKPRRPTPLSVPSSA